MQRELEPLIRQDLDRKIVLLTGPRQCGKTTLSRVMSSQYEYFNWDSSEDRLVLQKKKWNRNTELVILDELHKMKKWKSWLKGIYDTEGGRPRLLVTGSAKFDTYKKMGDSLAGRFFQFRLHPFTLRELRHELPAEEACEKLLACGGFPEPFLAQDESYYKRWRRSHLDIILRQDMLDLESIRDIQSIETLVELLRYRVGSPVSYSSLARDLQRDPKTVKHWLQVLENLYVIFRVSPYHKNAGRVLLKEPKYYFFDNAQVLGDPGARLENLVATSLKRDLEFLEDTTGTQVQLYYARSTDGKEIDFMVVIEQKPSWLIEVKLGSDEPNKAFQHFAQFWPEAKQVQLVHKLKREFSIPNGPEIKHLAPWLQNSPIF
ncbi:MAG: ATP-binding protein [Myxococcaceae bacterium]